MRHLSRLDSASLPLAHRSSFHPPPDEPPQARLDSLAAALAQLGKDASVEQAVEVGRLVIEQLYDGDLVAWRSRGPKAHSLRALARRSDLPVSSSALYRSIALYELSHELGGVQRWAEGGLGISHLRLVLGLSVPEQRRLLDATLEHAWTVAELEQQVLLVRRRSPKSGGRGGRPRLPRFVKSVNRLRKAAEAPGEMFGDLEAAAEMAPERLAEIRDVLSTIRVRCAELDRELMKRTPTPTAEPSAAD